MAESLQERRASVEGRLAAFHVRAGQALLDGGKVPPPVDLATLESELSAILDAEAEAVRRTRHAAEEAYRESRARLSAEHEELRAKLAVACERETTALKEAAAASAEVMKIGSELRENARAGDFKLPPGSGENEQRRRRGYRISQALWPLAKSGRIGAVELNQGPYPARQSADEGSHFFKLEN